MALFRVFSSALRPTIFSRSFAAAAPASRKYILSVRAHPKQAQHQPRTMMSI